MLCFLIRLCSEDIQESNACLPIQSSPLLMQLSRHLLPVRPAKIYSSTAYDVCPLCAPLLKIKKLAPMPLHMSLVFSTFIFWVFYMSCWICLKKRVYVSVKFRFGVPGCKHEARRQSELHPTGTGSQIKQQQETAVRFLTSHLNHDLWDCSCCKES